MWRKRVWSGHESTCPTVAWTESSEAMRPRASLTERARREVCRRVAEDGHAVAQTAPDYGVGEDAAMAPVAEYGEPVTTHVGVAKSD